MPFVDIIYKSGHRDRIHCDSEGSFTFIVETLYKAVKAVNDGRTATVTINNEETGRGYFVNASEIAAVSTMENEEVK